MYSYNNTPEWWGGQMILELSEPCEPDWTELLINDKVNGSNRRKTTFSLTIDKSSCNTVFFAVKRSRNKTFERVLAFPTRLHYRTAKPQISLRIHTVWSVFAAYSVGSQGSQTVFRPTAKTLIRLHESAGWSESLLGAHAILQGMLCPGPLIYKIEPCYVVLPNQENQRVSAQS